nr:RICIN domain-containing protein [Streptomyces viridochromogenes]
MPPEPRSSTRCCRLHPHPWASARASVERSGSPNGTRVIIWPCNGQNNQKWTRQADGSIRNVHAGLCLDAEQAGTTNGTPLILWTCNGQNNQKWSSLS